MVFGSDKSTPNVLEIKQHFEHQGLTLTEGLPSFEFSFGILFGEVPTLIDVNDFFVRFQAFFYLNHKEVLLDPLGTLEFINELNTDLTLIKVTLDCDNSDSTSGLTAVAILPDIIDPIAIHNLFLLWLDNLSTLMLHDSCDRFFEKE